MRDAGARLGHRWSESRRRQAPNATDATDATDACETEAMQRQRQRRPRGELMTWPQETPEETPEETPRKRAGAADARGKRMRTRRRHEWGWSDGGSVRAAR